MIMRALRSTAAVLALFFVPLAAAAQETAAKPAVTSSRAFTLSGYGQALYSAEDPGIDGWSIRRARLVLTSDLLKNVHFKVQMDLVKSPALIDLFLEFNLHEAASIRVGQFKVPFSLEMTTSSGDLDMVNRSQPVNKLSPSLDIGGGGRDIGAVVFGKAAFLEYTLGFFNGSGANKADTNEKKDLAGRLVIRPVSFLSIGASYYDGAYSASAGAPASVRDRFGADFAFLLGPYSLKADFIQAEDGGTLRRGWYAQGGYFVLPKVLQGLVRFDSFDPDASAAGDRLDTWTVGVNWFLAGRTKLQINYEQMQTESGATARKSLLIHLQGAF